MVKTYIGPEERPYLRLQGPGDNDPEEHNLDSDCYDGPDCEEPAEEKAEPRFFQACPECGAKGLLDIVQVNGGLQQQCPKCGASYWLED
jgi:hypothetical protein